KIKPHKTAIMDTRKTTPLLRVFERYAVRCGGGVNHRFDLGDMALVKDNHRVLCGEGSLAAVTAALRKKKVKVELEADTLDQLREALVCRPDVVLLDNMTPAQVRRAVRLRDQLAPRVLLEASGGMTLANVRSFAAAGVDHISIGALTHSSPAVDVSLEFIP